jgi:hypothetical protein
MFNSSGGWLQLCKVRARMAANKIKARIEHLLSGNVFGYDVATSLYPNDGFFGGTHVLEEVNRIIWGDRFIGSGVDEEHRGFD